MSTENDSKHSSKRVHGAAIDAAHRTTKGERTVEDHTEVVDYKMVTFSLGGKDYGIDIMNVKEIAKFHHFTYVPNTPPFVRGVYNLRGDIISIIDLRLMFNLPAEQKSENEPEDGLIIRLEDNLLGVVVDKVARVVGISRETIQPPHPIFADINLKYINGVVEHEGRLYIILDVERIFAPEEERTEERSPSAGQFAPLETEEEQEKDTGPVPEQEKDTSPVAESEEPVDLGFVRETLATFAGFHATGLNETWLRQRFSEWQQLRSSQGRDAQLSSPEEAEEFLEPFFSPSTGTFWSEHYIRRFSSILEHLEAPSSFTTWNIGCGKGYETYSLAVVLRRTFPEARLKIWANDHNLLSVSSAPNLVFQAESVPESFEGYIVPGKNGYSFSQEIRDLIVFEFHDVRHHNTIPEVDLIVARDVLSFLEPAEQESVLSQFSDKAKPGTLLVLGENEQIANQPQWEPLDGGPSGVYKKVD